MMMMIIMIIIIIMILRCDMPLRLAGPGQTEFKPGRPRLSSSLSLGKVSSHKFQV